MVTGASSGSGVAPALWSESLPHSKHDDGSFDGGDFLVDSNEEEGPPPMIEQQPALEQHVGGIVGNAAPTSRSNLPVVPRDGVTGLGIVGGPAASNQVHPPGNNVTATPPPPEDIYFDHYTFEQVRQFQSSPYGENGIVYVAPDGKLFLCPACIMSKSGISARDKHQDFCKRSKPFRDMVENLKKEGKYTPLVDEHSVQASRTFSTVAGNGDDDDSDDVMPAPKRQGKKQRVGPTLEDSDDEDDGKPAAKPAAKKHRALHSSDSASVPSERPLESGPLVPEGPVPPVAAMPLEAARAAAPKRGRPAGSGKMSTPQKGAKKMQSKSGRRSQESNEEEPYIPQRKAIKKVL